ncbi:MAG: hypothetical protein BGP14_13330 [Sphingobacteriales bacterium 44-15]|nr:MAG: hypothetical protein BGP14_13330 [Sphingobacteriales bacterium 44-15]
MFRWPVLLQYKDTPHDIHRIGTRNDEQRPEAYYIKSQQFLLRYIPAVQGSAIFTPIYTAAANNII